MKTNLKLASIISYILSIIPFVKAIYLLTRYNNSIYLDESVNAWVGGDAYNYIINSSRANGMFVLFGLFVIVGTMFLGLTLIYKGEE